ncbi:MAG TPA: large conductance mechanosensitive channel protein MscL [bacterium]|jgi:large conductance mechanosensitive channel|nr:large conductance mechanosensitive channel protein MscL [Dictyoglomota bacterium]HHV80786.1 large conductance mechanosensitive channel protein MscL [bacterium]HOK29135.1 large conductance mechanosensitive channel protein MscL [bacterium]HOL54380.1 large conductance mechanosensitive channel protein MscL [bacterium]HON72856.1 large conductance mechanosensitive channel protein MscL [bacterium]
MFKGFRDFIMRGNVVDLAVGIIIGGAFSQIVNSLVSDILTPFIGLLVGVPDFSGFKIGPLGVGKFINTVVSFLLIAAAIYFLIIVPMNKLHEFLDRQKEQTPPQPSAPPEPPEDIKLLREILETLKNKQ